MACHPVTAVRDADNPDNIGAISFDQCGGYQIAFIDPGAVGPRAKNVAFDPPHRLPRHPNPARIDNLADFAKTVVFTC
jgi:hypothetical protein